MAIRAGSKPDHPDYVTQSLGQVPLRLYAHDSYRARFGVPKRGDDLTGHRFFAPHAEDWRLPFWPWVEKNVRQEMIVMSSRDIWLNVEAISRGVGMGFLGDHEAASRKGLQPVHLDDETWSVELWLTTHVDVHRTDKVQAMLRCIRSEFGVM